VRGLTGATGAAGTPGAAGADGAGSFDQDLNTSDAPTFAALTVPSITGPTTVTTSLDVGTIDGGAPINVHGDATISGATATQDFTAATGFGVFGTAAQTQQTVDDSTVDSIIDANAKTAINGINTLLRTYGLSTG
jgi:hypothetical protein